MRSLSYSELCTLLGVSPKVSIYYGNLVGKLELLREAELITIDPSIKNDDFAIEHADDITISATPLISKVQKAFNISLSELASNDERTRLIVTPSLHRYSPPLFQSDLFVLMPFDLEFQPIYDDHFKSVAKELSLTIDRADNFFARGVVMNQIWSAIVNSKVIIADLTGRNTNVFYEIGLAHAIGKPIVLLAQNENDIPFDLRLLRIVYYKFTPRGMETLEKELKNIIMNMIK